MAIELKKFQAEFKTLETAATAAFGEWKLVGDTQGGFKKLLDGARLSIGDRIGELKARGNPGVKLDFRDKPDGYVVSAQDVEEELARIGHDVQPLPIAKRENDDV